MKNLHFELSGPAGKPVIIFLHGFLGSSIDWDFAVEHFKVNYQCLCVDLPGHGQTHLTDPKHYSIPNTARLLIDLLDRLQIKMANLLGYSMGGRVALYLAVHYPSNFEKVILESASPGLEDEIERKKRQEQDEQLAQVLEKKNLEQFLREWYHRPLFKNLLGQPGFERMFQRRLKNDPIELAKSLRYMGVGNQESLWLRLPEIQLPVLLLAGEMDQKFCDIARRMQKKNPGFRLAIIEDCGHTIHFENEKRFLQEVSAFLIF